MEIIEIAVFIKSDKETVWSAFTEPKHVIAWNFASDDWHCPDSEVDLRVGGKFSHTMAAKDGSFSFPFWGIYREIQPHQKLAFSLGEDLGESRSVEVIFTEQEGGVLVTERFVPENENDVEMQRQGWLMILENFKKHCESL